MNRRLFDILDNKKIFKLVLGLGNQSLEEIKNCCAVYAKAGCDMFDLNASKEALEAAQEGIKIAGLDPQDFLFSISAGVEGDTHTKKAVIDEKKCINCKKCIKCCPQDAIVSGNGCPLVIKEKCIGCKKCGKCPVGAISFEGGASDLKSTVELAQKYNIDCVELHISSKKLPIKEIKYLVENIDCPLSLCLDRKYYSNDKIVKLVDKLKEITSEFIIQADGVPMSGSEDTFGSTLQAVAMAHLVQDFGVYVFISGGTNSKTAQLAKQCDVNYHAISIGSFARKIIKNLTFEAAVTKAMALVNFTKEF